MDLEALEDRNRDFSLEFKILDDQRINPLVDDRSETLKLTGERKKMNGL